MQYVSEAQSLIPLPSPLPQVLFYGGIIGLLSSAPSFRYFGDLTLGIAPEKGWGWNAPTVDKPDFCDVPNAWLVDTASSGGTGSCHKYFAKYYDASANNPTEAVWTWDLFVASLKFGNGGPSVWSGITTDMTCEQNFPSVFGCWALVPFEVAIVLGLMSGGAKLPSINNL